MSIISAPNQVFGNAELTINELRGHRYMTDAIPEGGGAQPDGKTNPWGPDFTPERAYKTITDLRNDVKDVQAKYATAQADLKKAQESASASSDEKVKAAEDRAQKAEQSIWAFKAIIAHPELTGYEDFLTGEDEAAVLGKAEPLAGANKAADKTADKTVDENVNGSDVVDSQVKTDLKPAAKPGHGAEDDLFDPIAEAALVRSQQ